MAGKGRPTDEEIAAKRLLPKEFLDSRDSTAQWKRYLDSEDDKVSLDCWKYLHDRVYGKPAQALTGADGGVLELSIVKRVVTDL